MSKILLLALMGVSMASYAACVSLLFAGEGDGYEFGSIAAAPDPLAEAPDPLAEAPDILPADSDDSLTIGAAEINSQPLTDGNSTEPATGVQAQNNVISPRQSSSGQKATHPRR